MTTERPGPQKELLTVKKVMLPVGLIVGLALGVAGLLRFTVRPVPHQHEIEQGVPGGENALGQVPLLPLDADKPALLLKDAPGKVKILNFWATWCQSCLVEIPSLLRLHQKFRAQGVELYLISLDGDPEQVVPPMLKQLGVTLPTYRETPEEKWSEIFEIEAIPVTVVVDAGNQVLMREEGEVDWDESEIHQRFTKWLGVKK